MKKNFLYRNGLSIVFLLLFICSILGQSLTGWQEHNEFLAQYGQAPTGFARYLASGHFIQASFENWESEFFQMGLFVVLSIFLRQQGSSESKPLEEKKEPNELLPKKDSPRAVKKGGFRLWFYQYSLSFTLFALFLFSFAMHAWGSWMDENEKLLLEGEQAIGIRAHLLSNRFWFESFQNWQSEFLSIFSLVFLSIYLRQKGSPQSKKVNAPHSETEQ